MRIHFLRGAAAILLAAGALSACDQSAVTTADDDASFYAAAEDGAVIPGRYIVVLKPEAVAGKIPAQVVERVVDDYRTEAVHRYDVAIAGFSAALGEDDLAMLGNDPRVAYIEPDRWVHLPPFTLEGDEGYIDKGKPGGGGDTPPPQEIPWGIARVGGAGDGTGKTAWILDTGVDLDHPDLNVDPVRCRNFVTSGSDARLGCDDGNGHGTHVAGTIAALDNQIGVVGVAAGATVVPVKVLSKSGWGSWSGIIAGINYVAAAGSAGDVANMSLGGSPSQAVDAAVSAAAQAGVKFSLAAGNESENANNHSPARVNGNNVYTVSAIGSGDRFASFSNFGNPPVDWAAPGVSVRSTWKGGGYGTISGTSMATPHVAGVLLLGTIHSDGTAIGDPDGNPDPIAHR